LKIGIFTFPNSTSYGATLQLYALYRSIKQLGYDVEVINYFSAYMKNEMHCKKATTSRCHHMLKRFVRKILYTRQRMGFSAFEKQNLTLYPHRYFSRKSELVSIGNRYDAVVCGSDQVWNPDITGGDLSYFLDFCGENTRRISYAPSFGLESLPEPIYTNAANELKKFSAISARETSGKTLINEMTGKEVPIVIDPTLLVQSNEWEQLEKDPRLQTGKFIFYYTVKSSSTLFEKCRKFAEQQGMKMIVVGGGIKKLWDRDPVIQYLNDITPATWLWLVHHAASIVTNSFHGTAFSIIFEKDFYLELSSSANSRLTNIVNMMDLSDRIIQSDEDIVPSHADFTAARKNILCLRESSLDFLKQALDGNDTFGIGN